MVNGRQLALRGWSAPRLGSASLRRAHWSVIGVFEDSPALCTLTRWYGYPDLKGSFMVISLLWCVLSRTFRF